ncbi:MAG: hypothetical protein N2662_00505 [Bacteroidales bacterium]|nr:hypothetical protein [Bacteroidales bacterium]
MRTVLIVFILLQLKPIYLPAQQIQIMAGPGKNKMIVTHNSNTIDGLLYKPSIYQNHSINFQIEVIKKLFLHTGFGVAKYTYPAYDEEYQAINHDGYTQYVKVAEIKFDEIKLRYWTFPIGLQYEVIRNLKISFGYQLNFNPHRTANRPRTETLNNKNHLYYYGLNYTLFNFLELGIVNQKYLHPFAKNTFFPNQEDYYKHKSWYTYLAFTYRFKKKAETTHKEESKD